MATSDLKKDGTPKKKGGRPKIEFDKEQFQKLVGLGCTGKEIAWWFSNAQGKPANIDTISRWCKRTYGMDFTAYKKENGGIFRNIQLRQNQLELSRHSAAMAIFLGKNYLGQTDVTEVVDNTPIEKLDSILKGIKNNAEQQQRNIALFKRKAE